MRLTPFKQGRNDGYKMLMYFSKFCGRRRKAYLSGIHQGTMGAMLRLIFAEPNPTETITDVGELTGS